MNEPDETSQCILNAEAELERRIAAARVKPSEKRALENQIKEAILQEQSLTHAGGDELARRESQFEKWRLIHRYIHHYPYRDRLTASRSLQWKEALDRFRHLGEQELSDWLCLQMEVAGNIEKGIQDMRPRKNGPTCLVLLEYVANRKRKALAVLHWAQAGKKEGILTVNAEWHARTANILKEHGLVEVDETGKPVPSTDPMARN